VLKTCVILETLQTIKNDALMFILRFGKIMDKIHENELQWSLGHKQRFMMSKILIGRLGFTINKNMLIECSTCFLIEDQ
jgi:hypothetical protein